MIEGAIAGVGGVVTETINVPVLLAATLRSIARIGHCYGYPLDTEIDRVFVLGILELSTVDDPARRLELFRQLRDLGTGARRLAPKGKPLSLEGVSSAMFEDLAFGAVPILGDVTSILMDYDFVRRVDITARRVFQERWLKDRGKLDEIFPAPESRRRSSLEGGADLLAQMAYVGSYGIAFGLTLPLAVIARARRPMTIPWSGAAGRGRATPRRMPTGSWMASASEGVREAARGVGSSPLPRRLPRGLNQQACRIRPLIDRHRAQTPERLQKCP